MFLGVRLQPFTGNSNVRSACATRAPNTPRPITPTGKSTRARGLWNDHWPRAVSASYTSNSRKWRMAACRHACIVQAHHGQVRRQVQLEQRVDPRTDVEKGLQARLIVNERLRRCPHHGKVGLGSAGGPHLHLGPGQRSTEALQPGFRRGAGATESNAHIHLLLIAAHAIP